VPSLDLRFADDKSLTDAVTGQSLVTFTRASSGTYVGSDGVIRTAVTNLLLRSEEFNETVWSKTNCSITTNASTAPNGALASDKIVENTATTVGHYVGPSPSYAATVGLTIVYSVYAKAAERTFVQLVHTGIGVAGGNIIAGFDLVNGTAGTPSSGATSSIIPVGDGWYRCSLIYTPATTASTTAQIRIALNSLASPSSYTGDGTSGLFLWGAQLEQSSTVGEYIPTTSVINSAPRFDHNPTTGESLGLLVEEARTNSIRNNTMVGAVAGTPGTLPTNWSSSAGNGIAVNVIGTETENGISYIDLRFVGTATATSQVAVRFDGTANMSALASTAYTGTVYVRRVSGSNANLNSVLHYLVARNSGGSNIGDSNVNITSSVSASTLSANRQAITYTTPALTTTIQHDVRIDFNNSAVIDITLRIGLPQLEQGAFATSVIPTSTAAVTRSADVASITGTNFGTTRTNLLLRSEEFDNASWNKFQATVSANTATAPDGSSNADSLIESAVAGTHVIFQNASTSASATQTFSVYAKANQRSRFQLFVSDTGVNAVSGVFNLSTGAVISATNAGTGSGAIASIVALGNSWYRCILTGIPASSGATVRAHLYLIDNSSNQSYTGDGTSGVYIWGAQLEVGSAVTPYIPTTTAAVSVFESSWYRQDEGTVFADITRQNTTGFPGRVLFSDGTLANSIYLYYDAASNSSTFELKASNTPSVQIYGGGGALNSAVKAAAGWQTNNAAVIYNGSIQGTDSSVVVPVVDQMRVANGLTGTIRRLTFFPQRLPNSTLQAITQ
jgi:hypothetical protein